MKKEQVKKNKVKKPTVAPGNDDFLEQDASNQDTKEGNYTKVVRLSYEEVDPS